MAEINAKANMYALLAVVLLARLAGAVNILYYPTPAGCRGGAVGCYNVANNMCCTSSASQGGSVLVNNAGSNVLSKVFRNGGCSTYEGSVPGRSDNCYRGGAYTGAFWYQGRRRSMLADPTSCDSQVAPNSVFFTEDHTQGHWLLTSCYVDQTYNEMQNVPEAEKINWLKSHGAFYIQV
jgi:hypothetical protein